MNADIKIAVVTGGGHGIGRALSRRLSEHGVTVVVAEIEAEAAEKVAMSIEGIAKAVDVRDEDAVWQTRR